VITVSRAAIRPSNDLSGILRETQPIPFVRMEVEPGAEAQVDLGRALGSWWTVNGSAHTISGWS